MAASKSVPRLLQQQPHRESDEQAWREQQQAGTRDFQAKAATKGDLRTQVEAPKPNKEREVGDLEQSERETHARAGGKPRRER